MSLAAPPAEELLELSRYTSSFAGWLDRHPEALEEATRPLPAFADRVAAMRKLMRLLYDTGWSRYGWPKTVGGLGGTILHRAAMWDTLARRDVVGMALFEHLEVLAPTLVAMGPRGLVSRLLPAFLGGDEPWAQGFSEPGAGSDLASIRTRAVPAGVDSFRLSGHKIWTSWAKYARWCLVLARTGSPEARHRGLTTFAVDLDSPGVDVRPIIQANGTDELTEVFFDDVRVPADQTIGAVDGGWSVALHILSHERATFAWFRHCFLRQRALRRLTGGDLGDDRAVGDVVLDLAAVAATSRIALGAHAVEGIVGPRSAFTKLLLGEAEQSLNDLLLATDGDLAVGGHDDATALARQEYLFSRIVTVYGGSQQMQLDTIAKQVLRLP